MVIYRVGLDETPGFATDLATSPRDAAEAYAEIREAELDWSEVDDIIVCVRREEDGVCEVSWWRVEREVVTTYRARPAPEEVSP